MWQDGETSNPTGAQAAITDVEQFVGRADAVAFLHKTQKENVDFVFYPAQYYRPKNNLLTPHNGQPRTERSMYGPSGY